MTRIQQFLSRFWMMFLAPFIVCFLYWMPWQLNVGLALTAILSFAWRYSE